MTYDKLADEYLKSAQATKDIMMEYEQKKRCCRNPERLKWYAHKISILQEMYADCMLTAAELRRKANKCREAGISLVVVPWQEGGE